MTIYISHLFEDKDFSKIMLENQEIFFASNIELGIETIDFAAGDYLDKKKGPSIIHTWSFLGFVSP